MEFRVEDDPDPLDLEFLETQIRREASAATGLGDEVELAIFVDPLEFSKLMRYSTHDDAFGTISDSPKTSSTAIANVRRMPSGNPNAEIT